MIDFLERLLAAQRRAEDGEKEPLLLPADPAWAAPAEEEKTGGAGRPERKLRPFGFAPRVPPAPTEGQRGNAFPAHGGKAGEEQAVCLKHRRRRRRETRPFAGADR